MMHLSVFLTGKQSSVWRTVWWGIWSTKQAV